MPEIVQEIGAYAGLASVVGLAVLSALYFSQARDVKRLREWAGRAPERAEGLAPAVPGRVASPPSAKPAQPRPAAPVVPRPRGAAAATGARPAAASAPPPPPGPGAPAPGGPSVPATVGAGAKAGAVPMPATASAGATATPVSGSASPGEDQVAAGHTKEEASPAAGEDAAPPTESQTATATPTDAPATGASSPVGPAPKPPTATAPVPKPPAQNAGNANAGTSKGAAVPPVGRRPPATPPVPLEARNARTRSGAQPTTVIPPPRTQPWYRRLLADPLYAVLAVAGVLILGGAAVFGVSQLVGGGDDASPAGQATDDGGGGDPQGAQTGDAAQNGGNGRRGAAVKPGNVTVAVLNGTTVPGLATTLADQVTAAGFKPGTVANFLDQQLAESVVQYAPGNEREAAAVSRKLGIAQREAASAESQELAGDATVIVIVGGDKAP